MLELGNWWPSYNLLSVRIKKLALIRILNTLSMVFVTIMNPLATLGGKIGLALKVHHCSFQVLSHLGSTHLGIPIGY